MAVCTLVDESGYVRQSVQSVEECTGYILVSPSEYHATVDTFAPTSEGIATAFSWGFGSVVVIGYLSAYAVGVAKRLINLI
jgi:hypothetical protein